MPKRRLSPPELASLCARIATYLHIGLSIPEIAPLLNLPYKTCHRYSLHPLTRAAQARLEARSLSSLTRAETHTLLESRVALNAAVPDLITNLLYTALSDPAVPYPTKVTAILAALDRAGLTPQLANAATQAETSASTGHSSENVTPNLLNALTDLVRAINAPPPSAEPPPLPASYNLMRGIHTVDTEAETLPDDAPDTEPS